MLDQETIKGQLSLLDTYRKRLRIQLDQLGKLGAFAPPYIQIDIDEARGQIKKIKKYLRDNNVAVADGPEDKPDGAASQIPPEQSSAGQYPQTPENIPRVEAPKAPGFKYDVFISYSHADEDWVENVLLKTLEDAGLRVCIDFRDFKVGRPAIINMQDAAEESRHTVLVLTQHWIKSEWTLFESLLTRTSDPSGLTQRTLPLLLQPVELPKFISMLTWVDFTRPNRLQYSWKQLFDSLGAPSA